MISWEEEEEEEMTNGDGDFLASKTSMPLNSQVFVFVSLPDFKLTITVSYMFT